MKYFVKLMAELLGVASLFYVLLLLFTMSLPGEAERPPPLTSPTEQEINEFYYWCQKSGGRATLVNNELECRE